MKKYTVIIGTTIILALFLFSSCATRRDVIYFQKNQQVMDSAFQIQFVKIKPMDRLRINVTGPDEAAIAPFRTTGQSNQGATAQNSLFYTVDDNGYIVLPYLGNIHVAGMTRLEAITSIRESLRQYVHEAIVDVRLEGFRVTLLGATGAQVIDYSNNDRPTILDAIAQAGDLHITAKRDDILLIREQNGTRVSFRLDIRDADILNSPAYYLSQNDIIYVEPNTTGIQGNRRTWYISLGMTVISVGVTLYSLFN